jgi:hypothetical protein
MTDLQLSMNQIMNLVLLLENRRTIQANCDSLRKGWNSMVKEQKDGGGSFSSRYLTFTMTLRI